MPVFALCRFAAICDSEPAMKDLLQNLIKLQSIEFGEIKGENAGAAKSELRGKIPPQILGHYDRLVARGKKGVATVNNGICTACHMRVPLGVIMTLRHGDDIQLCENCGRYLCLAETATAREPEQIPSPKLKGKARKPKSLLQAA
jgi:predicted  nucleic acid-binding Zn-ribbon protein